LKGNADPADISAIDGKMDNYSKFNGPLSEQGACKFRQSNIRMNCVFLLPVFCLLSTAIALIKPDRIFQAVPSSRPLD
jgi:hypothetical protein